MRKLPRVPNVARIFNQLVKRFPLEETNVSLRVGRSRDYPAERDFAYCELSEGGRYPTIRIWVAAKLDREPVAVIEGILRHELGHAVAMSVGIPQHSERDADRLAKRLFGKRIYYDRRDVQTTRRTPKKVRPSHLPR